MECIGRFLGYLDVFLDFVVFFRLRIKLVVYIDGYLVIFYHFLVFCDIKKFIVFVIFGFNIVLVYSCFLLLFLSR